MTEDATPELRPPGFRLSREAGRWTVRGEGLRREATPVEVELWLAYRAERQARRFSDMKAMRAPHDLVCALNWIENMRVLRRHATETVGRASALTAQAEVLTKEVLRLARLIAAEGNAEAAAAARKVAHRAGLALVMHIGAAKKADAEIGTGAIYSERSVNSPEFEKAVHEDPFRSFDRRHLRNDESL